MSMGDDIHGEDLENLLEKYKEKIGGINRITDYAEFIYYFTSAIMVLKNNGFVIFKKERFKECDKCGASCTIWLKEDLDKKLEREIDNGEFQ